MVSFDDLTALGRRAGQLLEAGALATEEATKHALVMPFLQALQYDVFNPLEVVPEYTADYGLRQGEKVDYAIIRDDGSGDPVMLVECKKASDPLDVATAGQLSRYFQQTPAKVGILTNGILYRFFSDLDAEHVMDKEPFLEIDITRLDVRTVNALAHFAKHTFDVDEGREAGSNMRYIAGMKAHLAQMHNQPNDDFIRLLTSQVFEGRLIVQTPRYERFAGLVKLAFQGFVNDRINATLQRASDIANEPAEPMDSVEERPEEPQAETRAILTTAEEIEGFEMVKSLLAEMVDPERLHMRDTMDYCGILLDKRTICRLRLNRSVKYLGILHGPTNEVRHRIDGVADIAAHSNELREIVSQLLTEA